MRHFPWRLKILQRRIRKADHPLFRKSFNFRLMFLWNSSAPNKPIITNDKPLLKPLSFSFAGRKNKKKYENHPIKRLRDDVFHALKKNISFYLKRNWFRRKNRKDITEQSHLRHLVFVPKFPKFVLPFSKNTHQPRIYETIARIRIVSRTQNEHINPDLINGYHCSDNIHCDVEQWDKWNAVCFAVDNLTRINAFWMGFRYKIFAWCTSAVNDFSLWCRKVEAFVFCSGYWGWLSFWVWPVIRF